MRNFCRFVMCDLIRHTIKHELTFVNWKFFTWISLNPSLRAWASWPTGSTAASTSSPGPGRCSTIISDHWLLKAPLLAHLRVVQGVTWFLSCRTLKYKRLSNCGYIFKGNKGYKESLNLYRRIENFNYSNYKMITITIYKININWKFIKFHQRQNDSLVGDKSFP